MDFLMESDEQKRKTIIFYFFEINAEKIQEKKIKIWH